MVKLSRFVTVLILTCCIFPVFATDIRCCVVPERYADGRIKRSQTVLREFERLYPLPAGHDRSKYQINHSVPLTCGGRDIVENLMWMRVEAKTCAEDWCQDRHEQLTMCPGR